MPTLYSPDAENAIRDGSTRPHVTFVLKASKLCNLRCRYCYEFPELGNRQAVTRSQLQAMYRNIAEYYSNCPELVEIEFAWHGGERLLLGAEYYWTTFDDQTNVFDSDRISVTNVVQTNLATLDDGLTRLLFEGFDGVGVSIDLFGGLRVNSAGSDSQVRVLRNMDHLRKAGIPFGCITVLNKQNVSRSAQIFEFFRRAGISFRLLPVFRGATETQNDEYSLAPVQVLDAFKQYFDLWINSSTPIVVEPLFTYTENLLAARLLNRTGSAPNGNWQRYDKAAWESIYIVNTDGNLYSYADLYNLDLSHGNIFTHPLSELILSAGHRRAIDRAEARMKSVCPGCKHFGRGCGGYPAAEEALNSGEAADDSSTSCVKEQGILSYIEQRLCEMNMIGLADDRVNLPASYRPRFVRGL